MTPHIYSADEARELRDAATPGPWRLDGEFGHVRPAGARGTIVCTLDHEAVRDTDGADGHLLAAAPDLAASVEHHAARADAAERDAARASALAVAAELECERLRAGRDAALSDTAIAGAEAEQAWANGTTMLTKSTAERDAASARAAAAHRECERLRARVAELERLASGPGWDADGREVT